VEKGRVQTITDREWEILEELFNRNDLTEADWERYQKVIALEASEYLKRHSAEV